MNALALPSRRILSLFRFSFLFVTRSISNDSNGIRRIRKISSLSSSSLKFVCEYMCICIHVCVYKANNKGRVRRERLGWKSVALFLERASGVERRSPESSLKRISVDIQTCSGRLLNKLQRYGFRFVSFSLATFAALMHTFLSRS